MKPPEPNNRWITIVVPTWLYGGDPASFFSDANLMTKPGPDRATWRVKTLEAYAHSSPDLVRADTLMSSREQGGGDWSRLPPDPPGWTPPTRGHFLHLPPQPHQFDILAAFNYGRLNIHMSTRNELPQACIGLLGQIRGMTLEDGSPAFPEADLHFLQRLPPLLHRLKLPQVLLRTDIEHSLKMTQAQLRGLSSETFFKSSEGLLTGAYLLDAYLGPLLGALSPAIWGAGVPRGGGQLIFNLGRQLGGTTALASDLLSTIVRQGADSSIHFSALPSQSVPAAIAWWTNQLNHLFGVLSDPSLYVATGDLYDPGRHIEALLSIEQLFRRVTSIRTSHQDLHAARTLMFSTLDMFENLLGRNILNLCHPAHAAKTLSKLRASIPIAAQDVLLPAADRAVAALAKVGEGFFLTDTDDLVDRGDGFGISRDEATAQLLKLLRNATHGHRPQKGGARSIALSNQLLARHDSHIPSDLALLGHLYLLDLLTDLARLRRILQ